MGDPHRKDRYGEVWPQERIDAYLEVLERLKAHVVISGGWAWHFMSPPDHTEYKHAHDHKDVDLFVDPRAIHLGTVIHLLMEMGFERVPCRWTSEDFWRYEKHVKRGAKRYKLTIDFFLDTVGVPQRLVAGGWRVVSPDWLLSMYSQKHTSRECFAVTAARRLLGDGIDPVDHPSLAVIPEE